MINESKATFFGPKDKQMNNEKLAIYLEIGKKKSFAGAIEWPGWCRMGRDETAAIHSLLDYGERYGRLLQAAHIYFPLPADDSAFTIVERLEGGSTTDFGAPEAVPTADLAPFTAADWERLRPLLMACWQGFDTVVQSATHKQLRAGPRGGGRDLPKIVAHVLEADRAYLRRLAWKHKINGEAEPLAEHQRLRTAILEALSAAAHHKLPEKGPRGGTIWQPQYFIRRSIWHLLDHAWEIEDRIQAA